MATHAHRLADAIRETADMIVIKHTIFALPFAAIGVPLSEWFRWRGWLTYVLLGTGISMTAYGVAIVGEAGRATLWNDYAFKAFLAAGVTGGLGVTVASSTGVLEGKAA